MANTVIYGPQNWTAGDLNVPGLYIRNDVGGSDLPIAGYPEIVTLVQAYRNEDAGPNGEHTLERTQANGGSAILHGNGPLSLGQYDVRGLHVQWYQFFGIATQSVDHTLLHLANHAGLDLTPISQQFFSLLCQTGVDLNYLSLTAPNTFADVHVEVRPYTPDDAWHVMDVFLTPSTVTGAFAGDGTGDGGASVASDGAIVVKVDGVEISNLASLNFVINNWAASNPTVYYGWKAVVAVPPFTGLTFFYTGPELTPRLINSDLCCLPQKCCDGGGKGGGDATSRTVPTGATGHILPPIDTTDWLRQCTGGGVVPTQADLTDSEDWAL